MTEDNLKEAMGVYEAVKERVRMADSWSKSTGYDPKDYFDVMMDLRRMIYQYDSLLASKESILASPESMLKEKEEEIGRLKLTHAGGMSRIRLVTRLMKAEAALSTKEPAND